MTKNQNLTLELPNFEGPLDLLLHLIRSEKIDIYDIPISQITSQYLSYLKKMQELNLQIAGEYFLMSSTLLRIKSQYLLPKNDFVDENEPLEDPRQELVDQLVQYSIFKKISEYFKERNEEVPVVVAKEASISETAEVQPLPLGQISIEDLGNTYNLIMKKLKLRKPDLVSVEVKETPINEMIGYLEKRLNKQKQISFMSCIEKINNLADVIGLFLAMLEICKKHLAKIFQEEHSKDIQIERIG